MTRPIKLQLGVVLAIVLVLVTTLILLRQYNKNTFPKDITYVAATDRDQWLHRGKVMAYISTFKKLHPEVINKDRNKAYWRELIDYRYSVEVYELESDYGYNKYGWVDTFYFRPTDETEGILMIMKETVPEAYYTEFSDNYADGSLSNVDISLDDFNNRFKVYQDFFMFLLDSKMYVVDDLRYSDRKSVV